MKKLGYIFGLSLVVLSIVSFSAQAVNGGSRRPPIVENSGALESNNGTVFYRD